MKKLLVFTAAVVVSSTSLLAGISYEFRSMTTGKNSMTLAGTAAVEGKNTRIDFESGDELVFKSNTVMLSQDGGETYLVLNPEDKTYYEFSLQELLSTAGNVLKTMGAMIQMNVSNQTVEVTDAGPSEVIEGYPTRKYVVNSSYDLSMKILGMTTNTKIQSVAETWTTTKLPSDAVTFVQQKGLRSGFEELDKLIEAQVTTVSGFPLRQVMTTKSTSGKRSETTVTTTTISNIVNAPIPASKFELPAGYTKAEMPVPGLPNMPRIE